MKNTRTRGPILTKEDWLMITKEYLTIGPAKLAIKLGVSKQRIQQIATVLRKNGIDIPKLRNDKGHIEKYISFVKDNLK
jgi:biotin operon repressor